MTENSCFCLSKIFFIRVFAVSKYFYIGAFCLAAGSAAVMGNAVSVIIALVGVLNFVNFMVTAIVSRRREFVVIQSVAYRINSFSCSKVF